MLNINFRLTIAEEGCARILNHRSSSHTLVQLCGALGSDETGKGLHFIVLTTCHLTVTEVQDENKLFLFFLDSEKGEMHSVNYCTNFLHQLANINCHIMYPIMDQLRELDLSLMGYEWVFAPFTPV